MSHKKVFLTIPSGTDSGKLEVLKKTLAEQLGVEIEDVFVLPAGVTMNVLDGVAKKKEADAAAKPHDEKKTKP